jgi:hypothetical protein
MLAYSNNENSDSGLNIISDTLEVEEYLPTSNEIQYISSIAENSKKDLLKKRVEALSKYPKNQNELRNYIENIKQIGKDLILIDSIYLEDKKLISFFDRASSLYNQYILEKGSPKRDLRIELIKYYITATSILNDVKKPEEPDYVLEEITPYEFSDSDIAQIIKVYEMHNVPSKNVKEIISDINNLDEDKLPKLYKLIFNLYKGAVQEGYTPKTKDYKILDNLSLNDKLLTKTDPKFSFEIIKLSELRNPIEVVKNRISSNVENIIEITKTKKSSN